MSKFHPIGAFTPTDRYDLLPFRFDRLGEDEYVITNLVGEYHLLSRETLAKVIHRELALDSAELADLRAKHFVYQAGERAATHLLALKYRSKLERLASFTSLHIFVVTLRCDHSCPYCQVSRQSEDRASFDMSPEAARAGVEFVFRSPSPAIKIEFQGGEPLLNFDLVKYIVLAAEKRNETEGRDLQFVIATTLSLLNREILDFCKDHKILLSCSLDGPEDLHNANRPRPGKDSHQKFVSGLSLARDVLGHDQVSALMTTTERSLPRVKDIIDEYLRLGFNSIFLRPLSPYGFAVKTKSILSYDAERWINFYKEGLDYIIRLNSEGVTFSEVYASIVLKKMLTCGDPGYVDLMNPAGMGIAAIVFNYDGAVYASDESRMLAEMGDEAFRLGHLLDDTYEEVMLSDKLLSVLEDSFTLSVPMCSDCAFEPYCGADPVYHHAIYKDTVGRKPESAFCKRNMALFKHFIGLMRRDDGVRRLFLGWANR